ncbi:biliverdin-producing heme oxygenase [Chitinophaga sp.]|uniref:biliverdin-producing heme oxygenase n=1 Tax=Chitinophaga sp. TaxID=1869181 RepID=UPI002612857F|nr:biliverdin-producing heme oxygenase [uncultured Chitinophaga sp.]
MKDTDPSRLPGVSAYLKRYTHTEHLALEKLLVRSMKQIRSKEAYIRLLGLFYYYYHALETAMAPWLDIPDAPARRKAASILEDIAAMGGTLTATDLRPAVPPISGRAAALGAAYVLEGSTLGGIIIAGMISSQLQMQAGKGFSFFNGYGASTGEMWKKFREYLDNLGEDDRQPAAEAAKNTFLTFKDWAIAYEPIFEI